jgi:hypothetical protein
LKEKELQKKIKEVVEDVEDIEERKVDTSRLKEFIKIQRDSDNKYEGFGLSIKSLFQHSKQDVTEKQ